MSKILVLGDNDIASFIAKSLAETNEVTVTTKDETKVALKNSLYDGVEIVTLPNYGFALEAIRDFDIIVDCLNPGTRIDISTSFCKDVRLPVAQDINKAFFDIDNPRVSKIICIGNSSIYGNSQGVMVDELATPDLKMELAKTHYDLERAYLGCNSKQTKVIVFRCGIMVEVLDTIMKNVVSIARKGPIQYDGYKMLNPLDRLTLKKAVINALNLDKTSIYNLSCSQSCTFRQYFHTKLHGMGIDSSFVKWGSQSPSTNHVLNVSKAKAAGLI